MRREVLAVKLGGKPEIAWRFNKHAPNMPSPPFADGRIYVGNRQGHTFVFDHESSGHDAEPETERISPVELLMNGICVPVDA